MGTLNPAQMFDNSIVELSGRDISYPLDYSALADYSDDVAVMQGGVCTLNANGAFVAGLGDAVANAAIDSLTPMALFAIQGRDEFDANSDIGNISGGVQSALVASGGYELQTTEFVAGTYAPNQPITFGVDTERGKVVGATAKYSTQQVIGVVSRGTDSNEYDKSVLSFWTVFCPAVNAS